MSTSTCYKKQSTLHRLRLECALLGRCAQVNNSAYTWGTGTSMAAPHVAGVAAIYLVSDVSAVLSYTFHTSYWRQLVRA